VKIYLKSHFKASSLSISGQHHFTPHRLPDLQNALLFSGIPEYQTRIFFQKKTFFPNYPGYRSKIFFMQFSQN